MSIFIKCMLAIVAIITNNIICLLLNNYSLKQCAVYFGVYSLAYTITSLIHAEYCGLNLILHQKFSLINDSMRDFIKKGRFISKQNSGYLRYNSDTPVNILRKISIAHFDLVNLSKLLNSSFSVYVLLMILRNLNLLLDALHTFTEEKDKFTIVNGVFWSAVTMAEFSYMLYVCWQTSSSVSL